MFVELFLNPVVLICYILSSLYLFQETLEGKIMTLLHDFVRHFNVLIYCEKSFFSGDMLVQCVALCLKGRDFIQRHAHNGFIAKARRKFQLHAYFSQSTVAELHIFNLNQISQHCKKADFLFTSVL